MGCGLRGSGDVAKALHIGTRRLGGQRDGEQLGGVLQRGLEQFPVAQGPGGGGACWEQLTCSFPSCDTNVNPSGSDNPNAATTGFAFTQLYLYKVPPRR